MPLFSHSLSLIFQGIRSLGLARIEDIHKLFVCGPNNRKENTYILSNEQLFHERAFDMR